MRIQFITSVAIVTPDPASDQALFMKPLEAPPGDEYVFSEKIDGSKHLGVWPLWQTAEACFGTRTWPADRPVPQASIEFDVESEAAVADAARELEASASTLLHGPRTAPWGQTVARMQTHDATHGPTSDGLRRAD